MLQRENHNCTGFLSSLAKENCEKNKQALNIERMGRREQFSTHISPLGFFSFLRKRTRTNFRNYGEPFEVFLGGNGMEGALRAERPYDDCYLRESSF